jgi:hypothetical protein
MRAALLGLAAFLIVLLVRLPARWITPLLPAAARCSVASGTMWHGACEGLSLSDGKSAPLVLQQLRWTVHPAALLRARLALDLQAQGDWGQASAAVTLRSGSHLTVSALTADGTLDRRLLPVLPSGWRGEFAAREVALELKQKRLLSVRGTATVRGLQDGRGKRYGDFQLQLAPVSDAAGAGDLRSLAGPTEVMAKVRVAADMNWTVDGTVDGRPLSVSGNF